MSFFSRSAEIDKQVALVRAKRAKFEQSSTDLRVLTHEKVTSPAAFISSFATGLGVGWVATKPRPKVVVKETNDDDSVETESTPLKSTLLKDTLNRMVVLGLSFGMTQIQNKMASAVSAKREENQAEVEEEVAAE